MCEKCELSYEYNLNMNESLVTDTMLNDNWKRADIRVQGGTAITNGEHIIVVNEKNVLLFDKDKNDMDCHDHYGKIESTISLIKNRIKMGYYNNITLTEADKYVAVKIWRAKKDTLTCDNCLWLNGQTKPEKSLFWITINNKTYSLSTPPLHWTHRKNGQLVISCRCGLDRSKIKQSDLLRINQEKQKELDAKR